MEVFRGGAYLEFIEFKKSSFGYKKEKLILNDLSIKIKNHEVTAIIGSNGSGKTTLGKLLVGILKPDKGSVVVFGKDTRNMSLGEIGQNIGYLFQNPERQIFAATVEDEIGFVLELKGYDKEYIKSSVEDMLSLFHLSEVRNAFPFKLSHGEKERLALAAILVNNPEYLVLDEPTTGLDIERKKILLEVLKVLKEKGIGMTIISHDEEFVQALSSRIIRMDRGEIIEDISQSGP